MYTSKKCCVADKKKKHPVLYTLMNAEYAMWKALDFL